MIKIGVKGIRFVIVLVAMLGSLVSFGAGRNRPCGCYRPCRPVCVRRCYPCPPPPPVRHYIRPAGFRRCVSYTRASCYMPVTTVVSSPVVVEECVVVAPDVQCCSAIDSYQHHGIIGGTLRLLYGICFGDGHRPVASDRPVQTVPVDDANAQNCVDTRPQGDVQSDVSGK